MPARNAAKGSHAPATSGEWKAVATSSREQRSLRSRSRASARAISAVAPLSTTCSGWLWFAIVTSQPGSARRTSSRFALTAVIAPCVTWVAPLRDGPPTPALRASAGLVGPSLRSAPIDEASRISSPRLRAMRSRSASPIAPAAKSALTSPKLCPQKAAASTPSERSTASVAALAAPRAGCAHSVAVSRAACASRSAASKLGGGKTTRWSGSSPSARSAARSHTARAASKRIASAAPISRCWLPCPGNMKATGSPAASPTETSSPPGAENGSPFSRKGSASSSFSARSSSPSATIASRAGPPA